MITASILEFLYMLGEIRQVPRNIDKPNRKAEYGFAGLVGWYIPLYVTNNAIMALAFFAIILYSVTKLTAGKPEGAAYRLAYRFLALGKMVPSPKQTTKFEI